MSMCRAEFVNGKLIEEMIVQQNKKLSLNR